jgi:putative DNA primase/helicase
MTSFFGPDTDIDITTLDELLPDLDPSRVDRFQQLADGEIAINRDAPMPGRCQDLLAVNQKFRNTWDYRRPDIKDQSLSGLAMALASIAANKGATAQELCDLLAAFIKKHHGRWRGKSFFYTTISKALGNAQRHRRPDPTDAEANAEAPGITPEVIQNQNGDQSGHWQFELRDDGVWFFPLDPDSHPQRICGHLEVIACTRDGGSESWGRWVRWRDPDGREHSRLVLMNELASDGKESRQALLDGGLFIASGRSAHERLANYIQYAAAERMRSVHRIGWDDGAYVFPDVCIGPGGSESVVYQVPTGSEHYFRLGGTMEAWQKEVAAKCSGNSRLVFGLSAAFGAVLIGPLGIEGGGFHFVGDTSEGKTTLLVVAGSVMGGGGPRGFIRTWRSTDNALEAICELHNHSLLLLDELRELPNPERADQIVYMASNGTGKTRLTAAIRLRQQMQWCILFLSSGEVRLSEYVALGKKARSRGGTEVRLLNLAASAGDKGVFERLHGEKPPAVFADELAAAAKSNYGHAIRAFLSWLVSDAQLITEAREMMDNFVNRHLPEGAAPEIGRALRRFAVVAVGGELAARAGITGWRKGEAEQAAKACFQAWLGDRTGTGSFEKEEAVVQVRMFLEAHGASRFESMTTRFDAHQDPIVERISNRAGFWRENDEGKEYLIFPMVFQREVCAGFNYKSVAAELQRRGHLTWDGDKHLTLRVASAPEGSRFFCVLPSIFEIPEGTKQQANEE